LIAEGHNLAFQIWHSPGDVPCAGNQSQTCGGGNRLSLYSL
jgi:hypothetical protein